MHKQLNFPPDLSLEIFLRDYWQKQPVLLRNAIPLQHLALPADELAGLACEVDIESRLISQPRPGHWELEHGPFTEQRFAQLPERDWTLLVQDVDKHLPEVAELLDAFDFIPDWRLDDIMISYATDNGGVGPHTDNYDVFLIQAQGQRRWQLSTHDYTDSDLLANCPVRVLADFHTDQDWLLNPGDVLYLPPRLAHWGTAVGECMTWSVGMRGPSQSELLDAWLIARSEAAPEQHLRDQASPERQPSASILDEEFLHARELMQALLPQDDDTFRRWFGGYVTEPKPGLEIEAPVPCSPEWLHEQVAAGEDLMRHPWARFAFVELSDGPYLCAQGTCHPMPPQGHTAWPIICQRRRLPSEQLLQLAQQATLWPWLAELYNQGLLVLQHE